MPRVFEKMHNLTRFLWKVGYQSFEQDLRAIIILNTLIIILESWNILDKGGFVCVIFMGTMNYKLGASGFSHLFYNY